jgi:hypothetical protein
MCTGCPHCKLKYSCAACRAARAYPPSSPRIKREQETSLQIKQGPFTIQGYFSFDK